ncbi:MAG: peptidyl-prolyl cis-trans isomerase [Blastocatellia bacterium]|mgnify:CR=1 FL=1|jgi:parvulin-like peptidyl-prolyl isomerase|nr:peptidyl-prolyl cis-trans isomerase [Blastocatellia bacterium]MBK6424660.1 peptidyl-prolyl cis-trans isomerase [Blastocatellia bacterium]
MKYRASASRAAAAAIVAVAVFVGTALAQDQRLVEEVVVRVNNEIVTRSQFLEVIQQTEDDARQNRSPEEAEKILKDLRPRLLDLMIDNILLVQKGQDLGIDVEANINRQLTEAARERQMTITEFEDAMRKSGVDPADTRSRLRERLMRDAVMNQEVYGAIYRGLTEREKREYYEKNTDKYMLPGELKLSELFIPVEGRSFSEIEGKARELVAQARSGSSFIDIVKKNGDANRASYANGGSIGSFASPEDLAAPLSTAIANLRTGDLTDPIRLADGVIVLRVDERRDAAPKKFEEVQGDVALAITYGRSQEAERKYIQKLRDEAYIKVTDSYKPAVASAGPASGDAQP